MEIIEIKAKEANEIIADEHYLGAAEYHPRFCLSTPERDAIAVYSPPVPQHFKVKLPGCLELTRLWQSQTRRDARAEKGPLSEFLIATLEWLPPDVPCVFSYTDPGQRGPDGTKHRGVVYKKAGFTNFGESRVTDYWDDLVTGVKKISSPKMYRMHKTKSREILTLLGYGLVEKPPKILFCYGLSRTTAEVRDIIGGRYAR